MNPIPTHNPRANREAWLTGAVDLMRGRLFADHGFQVPKQVRISVGFPHGKRGGRIGECWQPEASGDAVGEIFIHPILDDAVRILDVVAHELVHTINHKAGTSGHGKVFKDIAVAIGLEGKMTATVASSGLVKVLTDYRNVLGPYPHKALTPGGGPKKQGTRLLKLLCVKCGYVARTTQKWVDTGLPVCPCGMDMIVEGMEDDADPE